MLELLAVFRGKEVKNERCHAELEKETVEKTIGFLMILCFLAISNRASAATGICKVFYLGELGAGQTVSINAGLNSAGYTASVTANPTVNTLTNALMSSSKILYVHTHGAPGLLKCSYDTYVSVPLLPSSGLSMAYLSACESAAVSTTYGTSSAYKLYSLGVPRVLGFAGTVYVGVGNGSQGLDYFDKNFLIFFFSTSIAFSIL